MSSLVCRKHNENNCKLCLEETIKEVDKMVGKYSKKINARDFLKIASKVL